MIFFFYLNTDLRTLKPEKTRSWEGEQNVKESAERKKSWERKTDRQWALSISASVSMTTEMLVWGFNTV